MGIVETYGRFLNVDEIRSSKTETEVFNKTKRPSRKSYGKNATPVDVMKDWLSEIIRWMLNALNWRMVRGLGELQILTRASYAMLLIVPILAGTWPAVRLVVNHHNRAVKDATILLERYEAKFNETLKRVKEELGRKADTGDSKDVAKVDKAIDTLEASSVAFFDHVNYYVADYSERTLRTPLLPWPLASAFFAALFVVLGHTLYQLAAPEQVRRMTWDEYVLSKKEDFAKHPSGEALIKARTVLRSRLGQRIEVSDRYENERLLYRLFELTEEKRENELRELGPSRLRSFQVWLDAGGDPAAPKGFVDAVREKTRGLLGAPSEGGHEDMAIVERAARTEYLQYAVQRKFFTLITTILYICGIVILASIIRVQSSAVAQAAGWTSFYDVFSP